MATKYLQYANLMNLTPLAASGNSTAINLPFTSQAPYGVILHIKFTLGSLTNAAVIPQLLNPDGTTWEDLYMQGAVSGSGTMAASTNLSLWLPAFGCKQFRVRYTATGTVTSSQLIVDATGTIIL
jgi:hypothetical protein